MRKYPTDFLGRNLVGPSLLKAGEGCFTMTLRNPVQGVGGHVPHTTCPAWGVSMLATARTGAGLLRGLRANPAATNSSTMKGLNGLAGKPCGRRCQAVKDLGRWVRGCFYVRSPEIVAGAACGANCFGSGELNARPTFLPCARDSDVNRKVERMTNAGSSAAAGWLPVPGSESSG